MAVSTIPDIIIEDELDAAAAPVPVKICPHLRKACRTRRIEPKIRSLKDKKLRVCKSCAKDAGSSTDAPESAQLWMCLACGQIFCGRYDKGHAQKHFDKGGDGDCLMFNLTSHACWCYLCDDNIRAEQHRNEILITVEKYWLKHAEASSTDNPEDYTVDTDTIDYKSISPGLQNLGNTCYFNSIMQCLAVVEPLHEIVASTPYRERSSSEIKSQSALTSAFQNLLNDIYVAEQAKTVIKPTTLFNELHKKFPRFTKGAQQDAQELFHYLLEALKAEEVGNAAAKPEYRRSRSRRQTLNQEEEFEMVDRSVPVKWIPTNFVESIFEGRLASVVICSACKSISSTYDQFEELSLSIVSHEKQSTHRRSRIRAAIDDIGRRSRNSLSLTRAPSTRGPKIDTLEVESSSQSSRYGRKLAPEKTQISVSEAVSEEEDAAAEKQLKTHTFSMSEAKSRLERLSFGFGRSRHTHVTEAQELNSKTFADRVDLPEPSPERLLFIERLLIETDISSIEQGSIEESLRDFTSVECLEGENAFACEECAKLLRTPKSMSRRISQASDAMEDVQLHDTPLTPALTPDSSMSIDEVSSHSAAQNQGINEENRISGSPKHVLRKAYKRFMLADLPNILVLHLKRFQQSGKSIYSSLRKVDDIIRFDEYLDITPFQMPLANGEASPQTLYRCIGCVVHIGTINSGHYVAYFLSRKVENSVRASGGPGSDPRRWVFASDSMVRPATWSEVSKSRAYLLFYERVA